VKSEESATDVQKNAVRSDLQSGRSEYGDLQSQPLNILLTGPNANSMWAMCGDYSFPAMTYFWKKNMEDLEHPEIVTLLEGMTAHKPEGVNLLYSRGCDWTEEIETKFSELGDERAWEYELLHRKVDAGEKADKAEALQLAKQADVIIAAVGENVMLCGENRDRLGLRLPGRQEQYVEELIATGKPVVLVVFGGRAQVISGLAERCAAVIQAWYPGEEGGNAVADILYGKVSPSGKLSVSYPNTEVYEPICYNYATEKDPRVQWPFGYGLSYTTFEYQNLVVGHASERDNSVVGHASERDNEKPQRLEALPTTAESLTLSFEVKNTGTVAADEVAQIYLSPTTADQNIRPIQLQGFTRVSLQPGETKTVTAKLFVEQFGFYSNNGVRQWNIVPGTFVVKIGASSQDIRLQQEIRLDGEPVSKPLRETYFSICTVETD
jgi:beta-glucosidase